MSKLVKRYLVKVDNKEFFGDGNEVQKQIKKLKDKEVSKTVQEFMQYVFNKPFSKEFPIVAETVKLYDKIISLVCYINKLKYDGTRCNNRKENIYEKRKEVENRVYKREKEEMQYFKQLNEKVELLMKTFNKDKRLYEMMQKELKFEISKTLVGHSFKLNPKKVIVVEDLEVLVALSGNIYANTPSDSILILGIYSVKDMETGIVYETGKNYGKSKERIALFNKILEKISLESLLKGA